MGKYSAVQHTSTHGSTHTGRRTTVYSVVQQSRKLSSTLRTSGGLHALCAGASRGPYTPGVAATRLRTITQYSGLEEPIQSNTVQTDQREKQLPFHPEIVTDSPP